MSQNIFLNPFVSSPPALTGPSVGNGTLTIDKLTHFTIDQDYTAICTAVSPFTVFNVVGSLDGPVGVAVVGTQFKDKDLKVFLTINQGPILFQVGDTFEFSVAQGTDVTQENIDTFDELPQKNFGTGVAGENKGDHNIRFQQAGQAAFREIQDLLFTADVSGELGNGISLEYIEGSILAAAEKTIQDLTFEANTPGAAGNDIEIEYIQFTPSVKAQVDIQGIRYTADVGGLAGNSLSVSYIGGATAGFEVVTMLSATHIQVQIEDGVSDVDDIRLAVGSHITASTLVDTTELTFGADPQEINAETFLLGGLDAIGEAGDEEVNVIGTLIQVTLESGVSTATQVKTAIDGVPAALALITTTITGVGSTAQTAPVAPTNLEGGANNVGDPGNEIVEVNDQEIKVTFVDGLSTAAQIKAAIDAFPAAAALINTTLSGDGQSEETDITCPAASAITAGESFEVSSSNNTRTARFYYIKDGSDIPPGTPDDVGIAILSADTANQVAAKSAAAIHAELEWTVAVPPANIFRIVNVGPGESNDVVNIDVGVGFSVAKVQDGFDVGQELQSSPVVRTFLAGGLGQGTYSFNTKELTDSGNFFEGNAALLANGITNQGNQTTFGESLNKGKVELDDDEPANNSGPEVLNAQKTINQLIQNGKCILLIDNEERAHWSKPAGTLSIPEDIWIVFTETGIINKILAANFPLAIADGEHGYVTVNRSTNANLSLTVAASVPDSPNGENIFRLFSRVGNVLVWWDNSLHREGRKIRIGEGATIGANQEKLGTGDAVNTNFPILSGLFPVNETSIMVFANAHQFITDEWSYNQISNQIEFVDPPEEGVEVYIFFLTEGESIEAPVLSGSEVSEYHTVSALEESNKEFTLPSTPPFPSRVLIDVIGGSPQQYGVDYTISGNLFQWTGYGLDGILTAGDVIRMFYLT